MIVLIHSKYAIKISTTHPGGCTKSLMLLIFYVVSMELEPTAQFLFESSIPFVQNHLFSGTKKNDKTTYTSRLRTRRMYLPEELSLKVMSALTTPNKWHFMQIQHETSITFGFKNIRIYPYLIFNDRMSIFSCSSHFEGGF